MFWRVWNISWKDYFFDKLVWFLALLTPPPPLSYPMVWLFCNPPCVVVSSVHALHEKLLPVSWKEKVFCCREVQVPFTSLARFLAFCLFPGNGIPVSRDQTFFFQRNVLLNFTIFAVSTRGKHEKYFWEFELFSFFLQGQYKCYFYCKYYVPLEVKICLL